VQGTQPGWRLRVCPPEFGKLNFGNVQRAPAPASTRQNIAVIAEVHVQAAGRRPPRTSQGPLRGFEEKAVCALWDGASLGSVRQVESSPDGGVPGNMFSSTEGAGSPLACLSGVASDYPAPHRVGGRGNCSAVGDEGLAHWHCLIV
jgi:hypothetical protein